MAKKSKPNQNKTWRPTDEDVKLVEELKSQLGILNESDLVRMGLRALQRERAALQSN